MKRFQQKRKAWFKFIKKIIRLFYKKPKFIYLGEKPTNGSLILTNHEGAYVPLNLEIFAQFPIRFWGTYEMNSGLKSTYKYLSEVFYPQKKHWNKILAKIFCLIAAPLSNLFYKGLRLISTYPDRRLKSTINKSIEVIKEGDNIVIFPEDSSKGYFKELTNFFAGFALLGETLLKKGIDVDVFVCYFNRDKKACLVDKPIKYSKLKQQYQDKKLIANALLSRCNELGKTDPNPLLTAK